MEWKEVMLRKLLGKEPLTEEQLIFKRKFFSHSVTARSIMEIACIFIAPILFSFFFDNRFAVDLGYNNLTSIEYGSLISITVFQLCVELIVIYSCSLIELKSGIPMSDFFFQFRDFQVVYCHLALMLNATLWVI